MGDVVAWCNELLRLCVASELSGNSLDEVESNQGLKRIGAYIVILESRKGIYIGSTSDLYQRKCNHVSTLRRGVHKNQKLQELFNLDPSQRAFFFPFYTSDKEQAVQIEQILLDRFRSHPLLTNKAIDAKLSMKGLKQSSKFIQAIGDYNRSKIVSQETRERMSEAQKKRIITSETRSRISSALKGRVFSRETLTKIQKKRSRLIIPISIPVEIDGVKYRSTLSAAKALGVSTGYVERRVRSDKFPDWSLSKDSK